MNQFYKTTVFATAKAFLQVVWQPEHVSREDVIWPECGASVWSLALNFVHEQTEKSVQ